MSKPTPNVLAALDIEIEAARAQAFQLANCPDTAGHDEYKRRCSHAAAAGILTALRGHIAERQQHETRRADIPRPYALIDSLQRPTIDIQELGNASAPAALFAAQLATEVRP
ncbi:hypothetical protein IEQ11_07220 [Lysobacter capsici]|uniref:hypothetical protein n=1 Tax=Lysobacter capsici TaxID=435897 RepID=UPI00177C60BE|nr:hypothetical protein [Lysobacter capsici]UOF16432.1 hypothetical protein IEQ11_07220 [Lysobacter capsici]